MSKRTSDHSQDGFVAWGLLLIIGAIMLFWPKGSPPQLATETALQKAKQALLDYAAAYPELHLRGTPSRMAFVPGHLPCPNLDTTNNAGQEAPNCGAKGVSVLGHLPWTTLGLELPTDGSGECLWYAVSGHHKATPKADLLNADTPGLLTIQQRDANGQTRVLTDDAVAVVFAPGAVLPDQRRPRNTHFLCNAELDPKQFLDPFAGGSNAETNQQAEGITLFTQRALKPSDGEPNDQLLWISRSEWLAALQRRPAWHAGKVFSDTSVTASTAQSSTSPALLQRVALCLRDFALANAAHRLPWAAPLSLTAQAPNTFTNDRFADQKQRLTGRLPMLLWQTKQALLAPPSGGTPGLNGQLLASFNQCSSSTDVDCRLFRTDNCPMLLPIAGYPTPSDGSGAQDSPDGWLEKWKDHVFYAVASDFQPANRPAGNCTGNGCLDVDGRPYAAILLFAHTPLSGQQRRSVADQMNVSNYLEGRNADSIAQGGRVFAHTGNDAMVCLRPDLSLATGCTD